MATTLESYVRSADRTGATSDTAKCYNGCSGRGACSHGLCKCQDESNRGWDCASNPPSHSDTGFIYVYDVDPSLGYTKYLDLPGGGDSNYLAEVSFLDRLMSDWSVRTLDPAKAKLFYTPTFTYYHVNNVCAGPNCLDLPAMRRTASEFWGKSPDAPNGEDHVYFFVGDKGACGMPQGPIYLTHWGLMTTWECMGREWTPECDAIHQRALSSSTATRDLRTNAVVSAQAALGALVAGWHTNATSKNASAGSSANASATIVTIVTKVNGTATDDNATAVNATTAKADDRILALGEDEAWQAGLCADNRSIIVPSYGTSAPRADIVLGIRARADANEQSGTWPYQLSFAGGIGGASNANYDSSKDSCDGRGGCYSQGVRQKVHKLYADHEGFLISAGHQDDAVMFGDARFCLAPSGDGFGVRLYKAIIIAGCVPLIIQPNVRQAFDELLRYDDFSLSATYGDIQHLPSILAAVTPEKHKAMRKAMLANAHAFTFAESEHGGDAYDYLVKSLRMRAGIPVVA